MIADYFFYILNHTNSYITNKQIFPQTESLTPLDLVYNSPGIGDNKFLCRASLYLDLMKPNNSLPLLVFNPSLSNFLHLNQNAVVAMVPN